MKYAIGVVLAIAFVLTTPLSAQMMVLESADGEEATGVCTIKHDLLTCDHVHQDTPDPTTAGEIIRLDGREYVVEWMGPGYYLESGVILEPLGPGTSDLKGQKWLEVYPDPGKIHASRSWVDADGNRALSASDVLELDSGPGLTVEDVRFQMRVKPVPPAP